VHHSGMTGTLEHAYGQRLGLNVLRFLRKENTVTRQIVLCLEKSGLAVEMALIRIYLEQLPVTARLLVLDNS
jgi:hypothetical protein